ncbi:unnamed protein product [Alopecurus aequalis]
MDRITIYTAALTIVFLATIISKNISRIISVHPRREENKSPIRPPHVVSGAPLLAALLTLVTPKKGLHAAIHDLHMKMGSVFTVNLLGLKKVTFLVGPEVTAHFFKASPSEIDFGDTAKIIVPVLGRGVLFGVDLPTRNEQIRFCIKAIKPARLQRNVHSMVHELEGYFAKWEQHGMVDLKHELGQLIVLIANRFLLGNEIKDNNLGEVSTLLHEIFENSFHMINFFFPHLPIQSHRRRDEARARLGEILGDIVRSRRRISSTRDSDDNDEEVAVQEQKQIIEQNGESVDYTVLSKMGTLHCCIREALRLYSPTPILVRQSHKSFAVKTREGMDYEIPDGHALACSIALSNKLPYIYKNPDIYDPCRFGPARQEDKAGGKFSDLSFGAGRYSCLGEDYAFMQIKVIWSYLLRNFELKLISPFPEQEHERILPGPRGKVMVTYKRRSL